MINAKDFGAIGDGKVDDTLALQAALDAGSQSERVFIPAGIYLTHELDVTARSVLGVHHWRHDQGGTILKAMTDFQGDAVLRAQNNSGQAQDLGIWAEGATHGLWATRTHGHQTMYKNIAVTLADGAGYRFEQVQVAEARRLVARYCYGVGFHISGSNGTEFYRCNAERNQSHGWLVEKGESGGGMSIVSCFSQINGGHGIYIKGNSAVNGQYLGHIDLLRNWIEGCSGDGIRLKFANSIEMQANRISKNNPVHNTSGISINDSDFVRMSGNAIATGSSDYLKIVSVNSRELSLSGDHRMSHIAQEMLEIEERYA